MRGLSAIRILLLATAAASLGWGQVPTISTLQSSRIDDPPANVTGVTSATASLSNGFRLYINGTFHPGSVLSVRWFNTITSDTELFGAASLQISTTQISVTIPYSHFQTAVLSPQAVTVTVTEAGGSSSATYTVNHPMRLLGPGLPSGTRTLPYDSNLFLVTGGTAPFDFTVSPGTLPPGLTPQPSGTLAGIPTLTGIFFFEPIMTDFWGNTDSSEWTDVIQIIDIPTLTSVAPNSSGTGAGTLTVTVTGTNFVARSVAPDLDGSEVQWRVGIGGATPLSTTFVSPTQLTATVPSALLATAAELNFIVRQAHNSNVNNVTSNALPFSVGLPAISGIVPASVSAGSSAITLTVSGANFVVNADSASRSTVSLNGVALATAFVNSGMLTAAVPAGMMSSPGVYNVQVANPGGTVSNTVLFSVLAPGISSLSTTSLPAGSPAFALTVTGANYLAGSQVSFRSTTLATTFVNSTTLTTTVPFGLITTPGAVNVQVVNPGGALSNIATFTVVAPTLSTILPTSIPAGSAAFTLAVTGTSFVSGAQVWFNGSTLTTTFVSSTALTAAVPGYLVEEAGPVDVKVTNPGGAGTLDLIFNVLRPAITSFSPPSVVAGSATFTLAVGGVNFVPGSRVSFDGSALTTSFVSSTRLNATVPAALVAVQKVASVVVSNPGETSTLSPVASFTVTNSLGIATASLPSGTAGSIYSATLAGRGGTLPYTWTASGYPPALSINPTTGVLSGVLLAGGTYLVTVTLQDAARSTATAQFPLVVGSPPVSIAPSSSLPPGTVGVAYLGFIFANGGADPYTFSLGGGRLPDSLTLASGGMVSGTPTTPGQFSFSVTVTDSARGSASGDFSITIRPAPLNITGGPTGPVPAGTPINIAFGGTGGVGPYRFSPCGSPPPGTTLTNGVLSGTPTTAGTFTVCVTMSDSTGAVVTRNATLTVEAPPLTLSLSGSLSDGQVGVPYTGQISAAGGAGPYRYAGSGLPDGLSLSASGSVSGTPGAEGQFSFTATATDSKGATATGTFPIKIAPADLTIVTASLPDGVVGVAYSANLVASGGVRPYTWTVAGLPDGVTATAAGAISGTPNVAGKFTVIAGVKDSAEPSVTRTKSYSVTIAPAALVITTASAPNGTVGTAYSATFTASGGVAPLTFSGTGLPAGLSMSAAGALSGTPTTPGAATMVVTVKDAAGASTSRSFPVTIGLPSAPPLNLVGVSDTAIPLQQPRLQVTLGNSFPVDVVVTLTLTFAPDTGPDDPAIQFSGGGRTARITVPAGATSGASDVGVQTGSVAGVIAITAQMQAAGQDVTPTPAPRRTIRIAAAAPVIVPGTLTAVRNSTGFTVTLTGYATSRELTQAIFQFTAAAGSNLQTTTLTLPLDALFAPYFSGTAATPFGSQFTYTQPFTVTGSTQAIGSVTVTLVNRIGQSAPATATLN